MTVSIVRFTDEPPPGTSVRLNSQPISTPNHGQTAVISLHDKTAILQQVFLGK